MSSTRGRNETSLLNFALQDFGALPGLGDGTALQSAMPSGIERFGQFALAPHSASPAQSHDWSMVATHGVAPLSLAHHAFSNTQSVHGGSYSNGHDASGEHVDPSSHAGSADGASSAFATTLSVAAIVAPQIDTAPHSTAALRGFAHESDSANHGVVHNGAPPPVAAVGGQLWFGVDDLSHTGMDHIDGDAAGSDVADHPTDGQVFASVGLDGADGLYFGYDRDGTLRDGHITNDQETGQASEIQEVNMVFDVGSFSADEVNAIAVDPINHIVFVGLWGQQDQYTGILEVQYNPTTGALTSPYNAATGVVTDFNHMLFHDNNAGLVNGVTAMTNIIAMQYDMQNGDLYYVDQTNIWAGSSSSGTAWHQVNGIYVVSTAGSVGGGTAPTPTELSLNTQFAAGDNNNYIEGLAINEAQGIIYFAVNNASNSTSKLFWMPITGGSATQMTLPGGVGAFFVDDQGTGVNPLAFDPNQRQLYVSDNSHSQLVQLTLSADGHSFASGNGDFLTIDHSVGGSSATGLYFDPLPTLSSLSATTTEALQGGSALTLLTAAPSITDPQDGASNKLHMGFMQIVISNAQSGDNLFYSGAQSGTFDSGKMTISWNSSTHTLTLTGNETEAAYDTFFQNVSFQDSGTDNSTGSHPTRTIDWIMSDGTTIVDQTTADSNEKATTVVIDRAPTLTADGYAVVESATSSGTSGTGGTGVLGNDTDKDGDAITVTAVNGSGANVGNSVAGTYGHLTLNANGSYSYNADNTAAIDAAANGSHPVDTFTYTVSDGLGGVTTTTVSFTIDRAPTVVADNPSGEALESGSPITGNVLSNDSDKDGDTLTVSAVAGSGANVGNSVAGTYGHITINSNGTYSYTANNTVAIDGAGTGSHLTDMFSYTANDGHGGTTTTNITVTIDRAPTVVADAPASEAVESGSAVTGNVLTNDSDRDGDTLTVSAVNGLAGNVGNSIAGTYGHVTINSNGTYSYTADNTTAINGAGTGSHLTDMFTYTASDGFGGTTTSNITVTIDRPPTVVADNPSGEALESGSPIGGNVLSNDSDRDGDSLVVSAVNGVAGNVGNSIAGTYGHITINSNGTYSYTADNTAAIDGAGTGSHLTDMFSYTASDGFGGTTTSNITVTLDRAPTVVADNPSGEALESGSPIGGNVLSNDSDRDGDSLVVSAVNGVAGNVGNSIAGTYGHITINSNGTYSYTADNTAAIDGAGTGSHLTDMFSYTASDGFGGTTTSNITVTLDRAPTVVSDSGGTVGESGSASANTAAGVLTDDSDRDGDSLTISAVGGSAGNVGNSFATTYGHITLNADGSYSYTADNTAAIDAAASGSHPLDTVTFTVSDGFGGTASETLSFTIDRPASATADSLSTFENTQAINGSGGNPNLLANDVDKDGDPITITAINGSGANVGTQIVLASGALLTVNADGTYTYDPNHAFDYLPGASSGASNTAAPDTFTYTVDGGSTVTVTVTVSGVDSNDTLIGTSGNDTIHGGIGDDIIYNDNGQMSGTDPHDTSAGKSGGTDTFTGDSGNDIIYMGGNLIAADQIDGGTGTDTVVLSGDYSGGVVFNATTMVNVETLQLNAGNSYNLTMANATVASGQTLTVQAGLLGAGDTLVFDGSADTTGGNFVIYSGAGSAMLTGGSGDDVVRAGTGTVTFQGGGGDDRINMHGSLTAADTLNGGSGTDTVYLSGDYSAGVTLGATTFTSIEVMQLFAGNSYNFTIDAATVAAGSTLTVRAASLMAANTVTFDGSADTAGGDLLIYSGAGNDVLTGGNGNDLFSPGAGTDTVHGGGGNDTIQMAGNFTAADTIDGGAGNDTLVLSGDYSGGVTFGATTLTNVETVQLVLGHSYNLTINNATVAAGQTLTVQAGALLAGNTVTFDGSADTTGGNFVIDSGAGNDVLTGGSGNDLFSPGAGTDTVHGGGGNDTIQMAGNFTAADTIDGGTGNDTLVLAGDYSGGVTFGATTLTNVETIQLAYGHSYNLTINNATVAAGQTLTVQAGALLAGNAVTFDGSADTTGGDLLIYSGAGNDVLTGGSGNDLFSPGAGTDTVHGGGGNDTFQMVGNFTAADTIDGGAGSDTLALAGDYSSGVIFGATTLTNVETIVLAASHSYNLTINNATVAAGQTLAVEGNALLATDSFVFDGSNDTTGGTLAIYGGAGNDTLTGGSGNDLISAGNGTNIITGGGGSDTLYGGTGADQFVYNSVTDSTSTTYDKVKNFDASADTFKITGDTVNAVDTAITSGHLSLATFDSDLASDVNSTNLGAHDAVLFTATTGTLHGHTFLVVDINGVAGYQAGQDIVIDVSGSAHLSSLSASNFVG